MIRTGFFLASALTLLVTVGCGKPPTETMIGRWVVDADTMKALDEYKNASAKDKQGMDFMMKAMVFVIGPKQVSMEVEMMGQKQSDTTPYTVVGVTGNEVTMELTEPDGSKRTGKIQWKPIISRSTTAKRPSPWFGSPPSPKVDARDSKSGASFSRRNDARLVARR